MALPQILGHGIDLVEIERIARMIQSHGERFLERCFTAVERQYADSSLNLQAQRYAVRFACKEAAFKAIGTGWSDGVNWKDVAVQRDANGRPSLIVTGRCLEIARELAISDWHVSLSHSASHAIASVIACG